MYSIGIDIGYATLKVILLDDNKKKIFTKVIFHHGEIAESLKAQLEIIKGEFGPKSYFVGVTGDKIKGLESYYINDILALTEGVSFSSGDANSIIEIGAQSSRYITGFSKNSNKSIYFACNTSCSAGTGSFLEEQVSRLGIKLEDFSKYTDRAIKVPRIAGRCSVFSKTDMIHHQQAGMSTEDILLGLSYALVRNYKANVIQRKKITVPVAFVGGVANNRGVVRAIKDVFKLREEELILNQDASLAPALGAALVAMENGVLGDLDSIINGINSYKNHRGNISSYEALINFGSGDSLNKHKCTTSKRNKFEGYVGIDIGSTSTNLVLIDKEKEVLSYRYYRTMGDPQKVVDEGLKSIKNEFGGKLQILGVGTTGSGRSLIGKNINADLIVNEITAQAKGAIEVDKDIDTIFEIGGQDSKYISVKNGHVVDFEMNKICAAGTGSFLEEQGKKLDIPVEEYSKVALAGKEPINLGERCTVFIEGNISKALSQGKSKENIAAGLSYSIVNNYLNRVVMNKFIGKKIFLQGGIAHNQSVVNAFRSVLGKEVIVPDFFSVTGAYGTALLTKEELEKNYSIQVESEDCFDMESEINKLFLEGYTGNLKKDKLTIGIPRVLFIHKLFPLFNEFFKSLGFNVLLSEETNREIISLSQEYVLDETCYPIKLINGHVASLINKKVDFIFLPSLYTMKHPISKVREDYACVYMQTAPSIVEKTMGLKEKSIDLLSPALSFKFGKKYMMETLMNLGEKLGKSKIQTSLALANGFRSFKEFEQKVEILGQKMIKSLKEEEKAFVIITRTYGVSDNELNMEIPGKLRKMGYKVLTLSNLPAHSCDLSEDYPNMYWPFGQHILSGARIVKNSSNLYAIYLTNHGCGPDTILSHYFKEEMGDKAYLHIEVDEHSSDIGVMTRIEAFVESLKFNTDIQDDFEDKSKTPRELSLTETLYIPYIYPYSHLLQGVLKQKGNEVKLLPPTDKQSLEIGKKYAISKEYLSLSALLGDVFSNIDDLVKDKGRLFIPRTEGSESYGQYGRLVDQKIKLKGLEYPIIDSPFVEDFLENDKYGQEFMKILVAGDIIMSGDKEKRDEYLDLFLKKIESSNLDNGSIVSLAEYVHKTTSINNHKKSIYAIGEYNIVYNPILNNYQLDKLELKNKVFYEPVSEMMYFKLIDYMKKEKYRHKKTNEGLKEMKKLIEQVSCSLGSHSPFDLDIDQMMKVADEKLPLYAGGSGRYRLAKAIRCKDNCDGILIMNSLYENTGTILKILSSQEHEYLSVPSLELSFDGSKHSSNDEKIQNFIYYI